MTPVPDEDPAAEVFRADHLRTAIPPRRSHRAAAAARRHRRSTPYSRTPTIAALYGARVAGISADEALADVRAVLRDSSPNADFRAALARLDRGTR